LPAAAEAIAVLDPAPFVGSQALLRGVVSLPLIPAPAGHVVREDDVEPENRCWRGADRPFRVQSASGATREVRLRLGSGQRAAQSIPTRRQLPASHERLRIISARRATRRERGKFYRPDAELVAPVYLQSDVLSYLSDRAEAKGVEVDDLVNDLLRRDIALAEAMR
jgi:hypothetical protein